jgi:hypothetical protein
LNIRIAERKKHLKIYLVKRLAVVTSVWDCMKSDDSKTHN